MPRFSPALGLAGVRTGKGKERGDEAKVARIVQAQVQKSTDGFLGYGCLIVTTSHLRLIQGLSRRPHFRALLGYPVHVRCAIRGRFQLWQREAVEDLGILYCIGLELHGTSKAEHLITADFHVHRVPDLYLFPT